MFLYFPMALTHGPLVPTPDEPDAKTFMEKHVAMVRYTDKLLGRLVAALEELGLRDDTIIVWTTDNGTDRGIRGLVRGREVRGGKALTGENGVCVPFIVNCPGRVPSGVVTEALVDFTDMLPTFTEIAGGAVPASWTIDGRSFAPLILGKEKDSPREWIFAMGGQNQAKLTERGVQNRWRYRDRVIRDRRYKLYVGTDGKPEKLVDVKGDPGEQNNLLDGDPTPEATTAFARLYAEIKRQPKTDADPKYTPLAHREWFRKVETKADEWKEGSPANWE
jgi:arylsulfatase A-like enzyme